MIIITIIVIRIMLITTTIIIIIIIISICAYICVMYTYTAPGQDFDVVVANE